MITIASYGLGNIKAFINVYKRLNIECCIATTPHEILSAKKIILPGVGSFDYAMNKLNDSGLRDALDKAVLELHVPVLGICVGMQMMGTKSDEGKERGLAWIHGDVRKFESVRKDYPLPHMGWNTISPTREDKIFEGLDYTKGFYFLHSYYFECGDEYVLANTEYCTQFTSMINRKNIYGIQCHPEKSHASGIKILKNFSEV